MSNMANFSKQREEIKKAVLESKGHPTAEEVYRIVKAKNSTASLSTVYRNLNLLSDMGVIKKIYMPNGSVRFDSVLYQHCHGVCIECGKLYNINLDLEDLHHIVKKQIGMQSVQYHLIVEGICTDCQKES